MHRRITVASFRTMIISSRGETKGSTRSACRHPVKIMLEAAGQVWTEETCELWQRVARHDLDAADAFSFTSRLARDRGWTVAFARGAVAEYRRFCFLTQISPRPVTPSEEVDEVWHLHLTYSRDYWDVWCKKVLGAPLHHDPSRGGQVEDSRFRVQYAETLALYERYFGLPPEAYWPATQVRFSNRMRFRVVDTNYWYLVPRSRTFWHRLFKVAGS